MVERELTDMRIRELREKIEKLPKGYISTKNIKGTLRHYYQWREGKQVKSKYIKDSELDYYVKQIEERKTAQEELSFLVESVTRVDASEQMPMLKQRIPSENVHESQLLSVLRQLSFKTKVVTGASLTRMVETVQQYERRDCYPIIPHYLNRNEPGKILLMYGLRRTGKTTMMLQAIGDMNAEDFRRAAYIKISNKDTIRDLDHDIEILKSMEYQFFFIDEITLMEDFIDSASLFSDVHAMQGYKFVLSGTDSLGFWMANCHELYDRNRMLHTTFISYGEHSRLLMIDDVDEYIRYGGTLVAGKTEYDDWDLVRGEIPFREDESTRTYVDTAISRNIQNALAHCQYGKYMNNLFRLYDAGQLTNVINRVVEDMNHRFALSVIAREFKSHDLGSATAILDKKGIGRTAQGNPLALIDKDAVIQRLMDILDIKNKDTQTVEVTRSDMLQVQGYLEKLDLIIACPLKAANPEVELEPYTIFTQPGMRYCQAQALVFSLLNDSQFEQLDAQSKQLAIDTILNDVKGRMLEDIVLFETMAAADEEHKVFKLVFDDGEFDMVIYDAANNTHEIYEIKHSSQMTPEQYRHLIDKEKVSLSESRWGKVTKRCVLYKGNAAVLENGIEYQNVEMYLKGLKRPMYTWTVGISTFAKK